MAANAPFASAVNVAPTPELPLLYVTAGKAAVVATFTDSLTSKPSATESTYALLAASLSPVGAPTEVIRLLEATIVPFPFGASVIELLVPVAVIVGASPLTASVTTLPEFVIPAVVTYHL